MRLQRQTVDEILGRLSRVETDWKDDTAEAVLGLVARIDPSEGDLRALFTRLLTEDFGHARMVVRLMLEMSKDELEVELRSALGGSGTTRFQQDPDEFLDVLDELGLFDAARDLFSRPVTWRDLVIERLKVGRGSAIKGQRRGRALEDFTEGFVREVFGENYQVRCKFTGATGLGMEKTDFAIPTAAEPRILIEVKAYGATGSKQTDILGDMRRIVAEKRHDTTLLFVTDGLTWRHRTSDLARLVGLQNEGEIARIYTQDMAGELRRDLAVLKAEHGL